MVTLPHSRIPEDAFHYLKVRPEKHRTQIPKHLIKEFHGRESHWNNAKSLFFFPVISTLNFHFPPLRVLKELVSSSKDALFFATGMASWSHYIFCNITARAVRGKASCYGVNFSLMEKLWKIIIISHKNTDFLFWKNIFWCKTKFLASPRLLSCHNWESGACSIKLGSSHFYLHLQTRPWVNDLQRKGKESLDSRFIPTHAASRRVSLAPKMKSTSPFQ